MGKARRIASRIWRALRAPWAAGVLLVAIVVDGIRVVDWHNPDRPSTVLAWSVGLCGHALGFYPAVWEAPHTGTPRPERFVALPDGSVVPLPGGSVVALVDDPPPGGIPVEVFVHRSSARFGVWTEWLKNAHFEFTFVGEVDEHIRQRTAQAWWTATGWADPRFGGPASFRSDAIGFTRVNTWRLIHELTALTGLALFARAGWYTAFHWRSDRRRARGGCPSCGYSRDGLEETAPCPECGETGPRAGASLATGTLTSTIAADAGSGRRDEGESP